jgi:hypothetical protein
MFFVLSQVLLTLALESRHSALRDPEFNRKLASLRRQMAERSGERPLVVLLGSSQVGVNSRPDRLPRSPGCSSPLVFNFGLCSADPVLERLCLERLLRDQIHPDWLLIEVAPLFFNASVAGCPPMADYTIDANRLRWRDLQILRRYHSEPRRLARDWLADRLVPCYAQRFVILSEYAHRWLPPSLQTFDYGWRFLDEWGWCGMPDYETLGPPRQWEERTAFQRERFRPFYAHFRPHQSCDRALRDLLVICRAKGIHTALMLMPDFFRSCHSPAAMAEMDRYVAEIGAENHVPVLDMRTWAPDTGFWDGVHFVRATTNSFTAEFGREALRPLLQGKPQLVQREKNG